MYSTDKEMMVELVDERGVRLRVTARQNVLQLLYMAKINFCSHQKSPLTNI